MLPSVDNIRRSLEVQGYRRHEGFGHHFIFAFVRRYFLRRNVVIVFFWTVQLSVMAFALWSGLNSEHPLRFFLSCLAGTASIVFLIPLHEWLHGVGYRIAGAPHVEYRVIWRQFVFYAIADRFVTKKIPFVLLALAPFVFINGLLVLLIVVLPTVWLPWLIGALFMHVAGCSGDFALISYFFTYWKMDPVTFDDVTTGASHFFLREER